jgi:hypothetical protein
MKRNNIILAILFSILAVTVSYEIYNYLNPKPSMEFGGGDFGGGGAGSDF